MTNFVIIKAKTTKLKWGAIPSPPPPKLKFRKKPMSNRVKRQVKSDLVNLDKSLQTWFQPKKYRPDWGKHTTLRSSTYPECKSPKTRAIKAPSEQPLPTVPETRCTPSAPAKNGIHPISPPPKRNHPNPVRSNTRATEPELTDRPPTPTPAAPSQLKTVMIHLQIWSDHTRTKYIGL